MQMYMHISIGMQAHEYGESIPAYEHVGYNVCMCEDLGMNVYMCSYECAYSCVCMSACGYVHRHIYLLEHECPVLICDVCTCVCLNMYVSNVYVWAVEVSAYIYVFDVCLCASVCTCA